MKNILITGASRGIGKHLAIEFAKHDVQLTLLARNEENLSELSDIINKSGKNSFYKTCDTGNIEQMRASVEFALDNMGTIDIAILNSGVAGSGSFLDFSAHNMRRIFDVNVFGLANGFETLIPIMKNQGQGIIAGVSSLADARGVPGNSIYCASKITATFILEAARIELARAGINVITIRPGFVKTDMTARNKYHMPFLMDADKAAKIIVNGILEGKKRISFPLPMAIFSYIAKIVPPAIFESVMKNWKHNDN